MSPHPILLPQLLLPLLLLLTVQPQSGAGHVTLLGSRRPLSEAEARNGIFIDALRQASRHYNMFSNSLMQHALLRYENATKQIRSGIRYDFTAIFVETSCRKTPRSLGNTLAHCGKKLAANNALVDKCKMSAIYQPWLAHRFTIHNYGCQAQRRLSSEPVQPHVIFGNDSHDFGHYGQFLLFKQKFAKAYSTQAEEQQRYAIFRDNMKKAAVYQMLDHGSATYGASQFADLTEAEFRERYLTAPWDLSQRPETEAAPASMSVADLPPEFDWRQHGAVSPVKNQGSCGSCWAFSTTGNIEGQWFIKKKQLLSLSEQELVDCDKVDMGCNGGLPSQAYKEIERLGGLMNESAYPYKGRRNAECQFQQRRVSAYVNSSVAIPKDEAQIAAWLVQNGPISIGINANAMQFYLGGVSHPWKIFCNPSHLDHGVLIVGYGKKGTEPYWIIKNSWGTTWGHQGYYLVYRGDGTCGLNQMCTSAVVD